MNIKEINTEVAKEVVASVPLQPIKEEIEIPTFLKKENIQDMEVEEEKVSLLNNVEPSKDEENRKHLTELKNQARNYDKEEWSSILTFANEDALFEELHRRSLVRRQYIADMNTRYDDYAEEIGRE